MYFFLATLITLSLTQTFFRTNVAYFCVWLTPCISGDNFSKLVNTWTYMFNVILGYTVMRSDTATVHALRMGEMRGRKILVLNHNF